MYGWESSFDTRPGAKISSLQGPRWLWDPHSLLSSGFEGALSIEVKWAGREADHSPRSKAEANVKCVELSLISPWRVHRKMLNETQGQYPVMPLSLVWSSHTYAKNAWRTQAHKWTVVPRCVPLIFTYTGLFKMTVGVLTTCHTQYTWDRSICIFLFNRTTLQAFVTYLTGALYVHPLWFYKHQHDNRVRSKLFVACNSLQFLDTCGKRRNINLILDVTP